MLNKVILLGRMVKDIEIRHTDSKKMVGTFTIAVDNGYGDNKKTDFINCVAWEKTAEFIKNWFGKGRMMALAGRISTRSYEGQDGHKNYVTEVVVNEVHFADSKKDDTVQAISEQFAPIEDDADLPWEA
jgi:single-strand DNA-binding protein